MNLKTVGTNNILLPDAERLVIRDLLANAEAELDSTDAQIELLRSVLNNFLQERTKKAEQIARLHVAIAPHQTLPPELLAKIFVHCMEKDDDEEEDKDEEDMEPPFLQLRFSVGSLPWTLGHICSRWRHVALQEPRLWNRIAISYPIALPLLKEALSRTGNGPVAVRFYATRCADISRNDTLLTLILSCWHRIIELFLFVDFFWTERFLTKIPNSLPALRVLEFRVDGDVCRLLPAPLFKAAPNLCHLSLLRGHIRVPPPPALFPEDLLVRLARFTHLDLTFTSISPTSLHRLLRNCENIQKCSFQIGRDGYRAVDVTIGSSLLTVGSLQLPHLYYLRFDSETTLLSNNFILPLTLPSLKIFLELSHKTSGLSYSLLSSLIRRSQCNLTKLHITGSPHGSVEPLLEAVPSIKQLVIDGLIRASAVERIASRRLVPLAQSVKFDVGGVLDCLEMFLNGLEDGLLNEPWKYAGLKRVIVSVSMDDPDIIKFLVQMARCNDIRNTLEEANLFHLGVYRRQR